MTTSRPVIDKKEEAKRLMQELISEKFQYSYYDRLNHNLSFRSNLPINKLQEIANQLQSLGLNVKATAGVPHIFQFMDKPSIVKINNSYDEIIKYLTEPAPRLNNVDCLVDTSHLDAINNIRGEIATVLNRRGN